MRPYTKKILLVAYNFPPLISPQSLRWFYLSRELVKRGYKIDVITVRMPENFRDLLDEIPEVIATHRTFPGPFYHITFKYSREAEEKDDSCSDLRPSFIRKLMSSLYFKTYRALNSLPVPDIYTEWLPFAVSEGSRLLNKNRYDLIVSSSEPRICHLVGYFLKKKSGITWIADYGDPWVYPMPTARESRWKKNRLSRIEKKLLKHMDAVTVAADGIKKLYIERYPFLDDKNIHVIPQGFDPEAFAGIEEKTPAKFRIVYCGSFYRTLRDPSAFFDAIRGIDKDDIEVVIAGRINEFAEVVRRDGLAQKVTYNGFLNHRESLLLQKSASALLHIGNVSDTQIPGKIYEYFGAQRPILCIRGGGGDLSAELVMRYNKGLVVKNTPGEIRGAVLRLYGLWKDNLLDSTFDRTISEEYSWKKIAGKMSDILEAL